MLRTRCSLITAGPERNNSSKDERPSEAIPVDASETNTNVRPTDGRIPFWTYLPPFNRFGKDRA